MDRYIIDIYWIDFSGNGIKTTYTYKAKNPEHAENFAMNSFKKMQKSFYGEPIDQNDIKRIKIQKLVSGLFSSQKWNNPK